jgi:hypothetical protein
LLILSKKDFQIVTKTNKIEVMFVWYMRVTWKSNLQSQIKIISPFVPDFFGKIIMQRKYLIGESEVEREWQLLFPLNQSFVKAASSHRRGQKYEACKIQTTEEQSWSIGEGEEERKKERGREKQR